MAENYFALVRREPLIVGFWRQNDPSGNNDATDYASRYGLTGVYTTRTLGPALTQADSSAASSVLGSSGSMAVGDVAPLRITGDVTIEAWIVSYSANETVNIASKQNSGAIFAAPYALKLVSGAVTFSLGNGTTQTTLTGTSPNISIPTHVVARCFRGTMAIFFNGVQVASGSLGAQAVADSGQSLIVGKTTSENGIDLASEVALYSGALSSRRITRHFTIGQQVISDPAHYTTVDPPVAA